MGLLIAFPVLAENSENNASYKVMVLDPADGKVFQKNKVEVELHPDTRDKLNRSTPSLSAKPWWPGLQDRKQFLIQVAGFEEAAKKLGWDDFALDEFIARAAENRSNEAILRKLYPDFSKELIVQSIVVARQMARGEALK
jgi:hypothetical protein